MALAGTYCILDKCRDLLRSNATVPARLDKPKALEVPTAREVLSGLGR